MKKNSIKFKIVLLSAIVLSLLVVINAVIASKQLAKEKKIEKLSELQAVNTAKYSEMVREFEKIKNLLVLNAQSVVFQEGFVAFNEMFYKLHQEIDANQTKVLHALENDFLANYLSLVDYSVENGPKKRQVAAYIPKKFDAQIAQYIFITKNPAPVGKKNSIAFIDAFDSHYMRTHAKYHPQYNRFLEAFGLYDIFLVNNAGDVIYTDFKEKDFATNLFDGSYKESGLARVFKKGLKIDEGMVAFDDFTPYEPSYNQMASFLATPLFVNHKRVGVLIFQMPLDDISSIMTFNGLYKLAGLGESGDSFLVGSDYKMRTNSRFGKTIGKVEIQDASTKAVFEDGVTRGSWIIESRGKRVLSVFHRIDLFDGVSWALISQIDEDEVLSPIASIQLKIIVFSLLLLLIALFVYVVALNKLVTSPLERFQAGLLDFFHYVRGDIKTVKMLPITSHDEIGELSKFVNDGIEKIEKSFQEKREQEWLKAGFATLDTSLILVQNKEEFAKKGLEFLCRYIGGVAGSFYLYDDKEQFLAFLQGYGIKATPIQKRGYKLHEGIVGDVGGTKKATLLQNSREIVIESAIFDGYAREIYIVALVFGDELLGVMEIATQKSFTKNELEFLDKAASQIAVLLSMLLKNNHIETLFEESKKKNTLLQEQAEELQEQSEELRVQAEELQVSNEQMKQQQEELQKKNALLETTKQEIDKKAKDLKESLRYKSEFLANMSHELRTPLNSIILLSKLLSQNSNLDKEEQQKCSVINKAGVSLFELINDILDLSKIEANKMQAISEQITTQEIADELHGLFESVAKEKGLAFEIKDTYKKEFVSDKMKILQILKNLLGNALKFTKKGFVHLEIDKEENTLLFVVKDSGIGIAQEQQNVIFEAFQQADGSTSREFGGTGLGLSISKKLSTLLGGSIELQSKAGEGSSFTLKIPLFKEVADVNEEQNGKEENIEEHSLQESQQVAHNEEPPLIDDHYEGDEQFLKGKSILIVDDDSRNIFTLSSVLEEMEGEVLSAFNGKEALEVLENGEHIDIILMDIMMPVMDGLSAIKEIKVNPKFQHIPIIVVSAKSVQKDIDAVYEVGADEYLTKPINLEKLAQLLKTWVS